MLSLGKLRDVAAGILEGDKLAAARQRDRRMAVSSALFYAK
jgi:hypothetical protein